MNSRSGTIGEAEFVALDTLMQVNAAWAAARYAKGHCVGLSDCLISKTLLWSEDCAMAEQHKPQQNHLLAALPAEVQSRLFPNLELIDMPYGKVLYESGDTMRHVYFPVDAIVSLLYVMENGASAEVSVVGNEGFVGMALLMGGDSTPSQAMVQSAGHAYRLAAYLFKEEFHRHSEMQVLLLRYTQALITQMTQTAVCNRHHSIEQQLCRWLLLCLDRVPGHQLHMTQELMANMLGVRREGITEAAGNLQKKGAIEYGRGRITVLDRRVIEQLSCECYAVVRKETDRLMPFSTGQVALASP
jgi:CRP-like cAMP-binding protein